MNHPVNNHFKNTHIEFHILQSFPVTCLNRDDVGAPKTAIVGGVQRARVSSQAWKRQVRLAMHDFGAKLGMRTKAVSDIIAQACMKEGATEAQAQACGVTLSGFLIKRKDKKGKNAESEDLLGVLDHEDDTTESTLLFFTHNEAHALALYAKSHGFDNSRMSTKNHEKEACKVVKDAIDPALEGVDIALFGRMVAKAADLNVEAAVSFAHAISTHKVSNEVEFFTALDDLQTEGESGSSHMGSLEFNSATYYRYIGLDLGQLYQSMSGQLLPETIEQFTKALFVAVPGARQKTQSGASPWAFAKILVRKGQPLQIPFETAVKAKDGGFLYPSIEEAKKWLSKQQKMHGSLFGQLAEYSYGEDENFSIDDLISGLKQHVAGA